MANATLTRKINWLTERINEYFTLAESELLNGHALEKHSGKSMEALLKRVERTKAGSVTSFYEEKIETFVKKAFFDEVNEIKNIEFIAEWLLDEQWDEPLCIDCIFDEVTGYGYYKKKDGTLHEGECNGVCVVLHKLDSYKYLPFYVKTAYPTFVKKQY